MRVAGGRHAAVVLAGAVVALSCARSAAPVVDPPLRLGVQLSGCAAVPSPGSCEIDAAAPLRVLVKGDAEARVTVEIDGREVAAGGSAIGGGQLLSFEAPAASRSLVVVARRGTASSRQRFTLGPRLEVPAVGEAVALQRRGDLSSAMARLAPALAGPDPVARQQALRRRARFSFMMGNAALLPSQLDEAIAADRAAGRLSDEIEDRLMLSFVHQEADRLGPARAAVDAAEPLLDGAPDLWAEAPYYRGLIALRAGDLRGALRAFDTSVHRSQLLGRTGPTVADALQLLAETLARLGRDREAIARLDDAVRADSRDGSACDQAARLNNRGWIALRLPPAARVDESGRRIDPAALFTEAAERLRSCGEPQSLAHALTNRAAAARELGERAAARRDLAEARRAAAGDDRQLLPEWLATEAGLLLDEGRSEAALRRFEELARADPRLEWRLEAAEGRARSLDRLGRGPEARAAYGEAEQILDEWSREVPLGEGRDAFLARGARYIRRRVDSLLAAAAVDEAAAEARRGRAWTLAALHWLDRPGLLAPDARERWELARARWQEARARFDARAAEVRLLPPALRRAAEAELGEEQVALRRSLDEAIGSLGAAPEGLVHRYAPPLPDDGVLLLVYHPSGDGWAAFAISSRGTQARRLSLPEPPAAASPAQLAAALLAPFDDAIAAARQVRIAAATPLDAADLHTLPWRGRPLVESVPVAFTLDLPRASAAAPALPVPAALLVADPREDLLAARVEADAVTASLHARGVATRELRGPAATHAAVRPLLEEPAIGLLHYAGHGRFDGREGWESALPLAAEGALTVGDILTLRRAPARVVLSACDGARSRGASGIGLAQAFLLRGATQAIAATRAVPDEVAARWMRALYQVGDPLADLPTALHEALLSLPVDERADAAAFRALVR